MPERLIRLSAATSIVEKITGERPHAATCHRWATRGLQGVRLRTAYAGGVRRTTEPWIHEFFEAVTAAKDRERTGATAPDSSRLKAREAALLAAHAELEAAGM